MQAGELFSWEKHHLFKVTLGEPAQPLSKQVSISRQPGVLPLRSPRAEGTSSSIPVPAWPTPPSPHSLCDSLSRVTTSGSPGGSCGSRAIIPVTITL